MKKTFIAFAALFMAVLTSCSSDNTKTITPTSTDFNSGTLGEYIEVVDQACELTYTISDDTMQNVRLKVTLKLIKEGFKDVSATDIYFTNSNLIWGNVATIELLDESHMYVMRVDLSSDDELKLKELLTGNEGDTVEVIFENSFDQSCDAQSWFKKVEQFRPDNSWEITVNGSLVVDDSLDSDVEALEESSDDSANWESVDEEMSSSETSSAALDETLDEYEEFVDNYIIYLKKAANGDMSAISEYTEMLQNAQRIGEELSKSQSVMTSQQANRLLEIQTKLAKAAQNM